MYDDFTPFLIAVGCIFALIIWIIVWLAIPKRPKKEEQTVVAVYRGNSYTDMLSAAELCPHNCCEFTEFGQYVLVKTKDSVAFQRQHPEAKILSVRNDSKPIY